MKQYRDSLKLRIALLIPGAAILVALLVLSKTGVLHAAASNSFSDFLRGFQTGILFTVIVLFIYMIVRYLRLLKNEERLKGAYYAENDERYKLIMMKMGGNAMYVCTIAILIAGITAGYFNETVFFSLAGCALFLLLVRFSLKIYYHSKY